MMTLTFAFAILSSVTTQAVFAHELQAGPAVNSTEIENELMKELAGAVSEDLSGRDDAPAPRAHVESFEEALRPIFAALPKDRYGRVSHALARYALHRVFTKRYNWYVRGLEPGAAAPKTQPGILHQTNFSLLSVAQWPSIIQGKLEHLHGGGLTLHDIAAVAATLEDLVHHETISRLNMAYDGGSREAGSALSQEDVTSVVDNYMVLFLSQMFMTDLTTEVLEEKRDLRMGGRDWQERVNPWLRKLQSEALPIEGDVSFDSLVRFGDEIGRRYGELHRADCMRLKELFTGMEARVPGRIRLSEFYNTSRYTKWGFTEKIEYLRALGALDETNASDPLVIFTNYMTSMPQCMKPSSIFSMCCPNECEALMSRLETKIVAPGADVDYVARLVADLRSGAAPEKLSENLIRRLHEISDLHGGFVPLHGRLFAQWMHHAFPRECPYPHQAGEAAPLTPDEWMKESGHTDSQASDAEMLQHIHADETCPVTGCPKGADDLIPWTPFEELLYAHDAEPPLPPPLVVAASTPPLVAAGPTPPLAAATSTPPVVAASTPPPIATAFAPAPAERAAATPPAAALQAASAPAARHHGFSGSDPVAEAQEAVKTIVQQTSQEAAPPLPESVGFGSYLLRLAAVCVVGSLLAFARAHTAPHKGKRINRAALECSGKFV